MFDVSVHAENAGLPLSSTPVRYRPTCRKSLEPRVNAQHSPLQPFTLKQTFASSLHLTCTALASIMRSCHSTQMTYSAASTRSHTVRSGGL
jgi:hypothetical protein